MIKKELRNPVITPVGKIEGRDAIILEKINLSEKEIQISGNIYGGHCTNAEGNRNMPFWVTFVDIISFRMVELDFCDDALEYKSCFDEIENSKELQRLRKIEGGCPEKLTPNHKHYIFMTYDSVFDVIAAKYKLKIF